MSAITSFISKIQSFMTYPRRFALFEMLIFVSLLIIFAHWNPFGILYKVQFLLLVLFFMVICYVFVESRESSRMNPGSVPPSFTAFIKSFLMFAGSIGLVVGLIIFTVWAIRHSSIFQSMLVWSTNILLIIGAVALLLKIFKGNTGKCDDSKVYSLFDLLPSMFIRFAEFIKREYKLTSKIVWIVLALEVAVISLRFLIPYLAKFMMSHDGEELLTDPIYLENETKVSTFEQLYGDVSEVTKYKYRYSLSAWFTMNPQPPNTRAAYTKYTNILNYGNKPRVQFNAAENTLRVQSETSSGDIVDVYSVKDAVPYQKWNHIVINYDGGYMDVFLNGVLVASKPNIAPYMQYDDVVVGENKGLEGGVRSVVYYDRILTAGEVSMEYKLLGGARRGL